MSILVTNDDGYQAPGIIALEEASQRFGEVWVVAPRHNQSYMGHRVTDGFIQVEQVSERHYVVDGTPADCVRIAALGLKLPITVVYSGVNNGGNLGSDTFTSGTVAAAREAALHGIPAVAFSQFRRGQVISDANWNIVTDRVCSVIDRIAVKRSRNGVVSQVAKNYFWNVNFPYPREFGSAVEIVECEVDRLPNDIRLERCPVSGGFNHVGIYSNRPRREGFDVHWVLDRDAITISRCFL